MFKGKKVVHIVARGLNGEIGANNKLLWNIPEDLKFFKDSTIGHVVLMGRKTAESLPSKLKNRIMVIVSTRFYDEHDESTPLQDSLDTAYFGSCKLNADKIFIAGGNQLYSSTFDIVDELWITQVEEGYPEADTFYQTPEGFKLTDEFYGEGCKDVGYSFQKWVKA